jgi:hypothetical protein
MANEVKDGEKYLLIKQSDAQAVLNYLGQRPCAEVYNLVGIMLGLKEAPISPPAELPIVDVTPVPKE